MDYEIIQINDNTWRIENNGVRFFLLTGTDRALLIDTGMTTKNAKEIAEALTVLPLSLLNTHADRDHTGGNGAFDTLYLHPAEEEHYRADGGTGQILPVGEGDTLDLGGRRLEVIHLPGHTPGSIALLDVGNRVLIGGDPIQDGHIFMFGPHRCMEDYIRSLEHLRQWKGQFDEIWPSHGTIPVSPALIGQLRDGARAVLDGSAAGKPAELFGTPITVYDVGCAMFLCDAKGKGAQHGTV